MPLGTNYNNNKNEARSEYNVSVDSYYRFYNAESSVDKTAVKFSFWNNMLKVTIAPKSNTNATNQNGDAFNSFDWNDGTTSAFITPVKAKMLYDEIERFQNNPGEYTNVGIPLGASGSGIIYICDGKEFGVNSICMVIVTVNNSGAVESTAVYEFKSQYNFSIRNYDAGNKNFDKIYYDTIELDIFKMILKQYYEAVSGAYAYTVMNANIRNTVRYKKSFEAIASKLGVDLGYSTTNYDNSKRNNSTFFNSNNGNNSKPEPNFVNASIDSLIS